MNPRIRGWRIWLLMGAIVIIAFLWATEYLDLPHVLLGAPTTPVNEPEVLLETMVTAAATVIGWWVLRYYERGWLQALNELQRLATTDDLTGALNRRECLSRAAEEFERAIRYGRPLSVAMLDLDDFKSINDRYGHMAGDRTLREFTGVVRNHIRLQDHLGRLGGDEFLVLFIETEPPEAAAVIERIRAQWGENQGDKPSPIRSAVTISAGVSAPRQEDGSVTDSIRRADKALYHAKTSGRNRIELA